MRNDPLKRSKARLAAGELSALTPAPGFQSASRRTTAIFCAAAVFACAANGPAAVAGDGTERVTVTATGQTTINPDIAEIRALVSANAPLAADALKKFRDNRRRAIETLQRLKVANLEVVGGGLSLHSTNANAQRVVQMFGGNANNAAAGQATAAEALTIRLSAVDRLKPDELANLVVKVVDAAKDAGLAVGSQSGIQSDLVRYRSTKLDSARAAALQAAITAARRKAEALTSSSPGHTLRLAAAREIPPAQAAKDFSGMNWYIMMAMAEAGVSNSSDAEDLSSIELKPIPVSLTLEFQFVISGGK